MRRTWAIVSFCVLGAVMLGTGVSCGRIDCDLDNLGRVVFKNQGNATMELYVGGEYKATLTPGGDSEQWLDAGNQGYEFKWEDGSAACSPGTLTVLKCESYEASCNATR